MGERSRRRTRRRRMRKKREKNRKVWGLVRCDFLRELPFDLVLEVLIRLPLKQLLRCMFVSKDWCSIIRQSSFIEAYHSRKPYCLVLSIPQELDNALSVRRRLYCSNISASGQEEFFKMFDFSSPDATIVGNLVGSCGVTRMVNGFFCSYMRTHVVLVNVFNREVTRLPDPHVTSTPSPAIPKDAPLKYYLGYDPINCLYKLLCLFEIDPRRLGMRILAFDGDSDRDCIWDMVGTNSCSNRKFGAPALFQLGDSTLVNGVLYWIVDGKSKFEEYRIFGCNLAASYVFYLKPKEFLIRPRLMQFRGRLSLFSCVGGSMVIHTVENGDLQKEFVYSWTEHKCALPSEFRCDGKYTAIPVGNLPTGELLLVNPKTHSSVNPIYAYNHENNEFVRFAVEKFPQSVDLEDRGEIDSVVSCIEQNLEVLINQFGPRY